jgi:hypothetical protein
MTTIEVELTKAIYWSALRASHLTLAIEPAHCACSALGQFVTYQWQRARKNMFVSIGFFRTL